MLKAEWFRPVVDLPCPRQDIQNKTKALLWNRIKSQCLPVIDASAKASVGSSQVTATTRQKPAALAR
jgi:hypothetical protein